MAAQAMILRLVLAGMAVLMAILVNVQAHASYYPSPLTPGSPPAHTPPPPPPKKKSPSPPKKPPPPPPKKKPPSPPPPPPPPKKKPSPPPPPPKKKPPPPPPPPKKKLPPPLPPKKKPPPPPPPKKKAPPPPSPKKNLPPPPKKKPPPPPPPKKKPPPPPPPKKKTPPPLPPKKKPPPPPPPKKKAPPPPSPKKNPPPPPKKKPPPPPPPKKKPPPPPPHKMKPPSPPPPKKKTPPPPPPKKKPPPPSPPKKKPPPPPPPKKKSPPPSPYHPTPPPPSVPTPTPTPPPPVSTPPPPSVPTLTPPPPLPASNPPPPSVPINNLPPTTPTSTPPPYIPYPPPLVAGKMVYCGNSTYRTCYRQPKRCPSDCLDTCEVNCVTCSPVCNCNQPGAVCQDPRFVGADGIAFYFHGKKDQDFCILSDSNLHINAHFIGRRNEDMKRDFTWVQSLGILFDSHQIFIGARKTATWDSAIDRLDLEFDGKSVYLSEGEGEKWEPSSETGISITRTRDTNAVVIEVEGNFKIKANVVPITERESMVHQYGITDEDCFAHLDLGFKFYSLTGYVNGVLGQTYSRNYTSRAKMGTDMPVLGGQKEFSSSNLFSTDCSVARFSGTSSSWITENNFEFANLNCASGLDGHGIVCKR